jgi:hypothetical protein
MKGLKCGPFIFCKNNIGAKISILGCMFSGIDLVRMPHKGWMKNGSSFAQKWMKIKTLVIGRLPVILFVKNT